MIVPVLKYLLHRLTRECWRLEQGMYYCSLEKCSFLYAYICTMYCNILSCTYLDMYSSFLLFWIGCLHKPTHFCCVVVAVGYNSYAAKGCNLDMHGNKLAMSVIPIGDHWYLRHLLLVGLWKLTKKWEVSRRGEQVQQWVSWTHSEKVSTLFLLSDVTSFFAAGWCCLQRWQQNLQWSKKIKPILSDRVIWLVPVIGNVTSFILLLRLPRSRGFYFMRLACKVINTDNQLSSDEAPEECVVFHTHLACLLFLWHTALVKGSFLISVLLVVA